MRRVTCLVFATALSTMVGIPVTTAATKAGITMPDRMMAGDTQLVLNGMGLREATVLKVDVYVAGLYVEKPSSNPAQLIGSNQTKRLALHFLRDVDRSDILKAWNDGFRNNATVNLAAIKDEIALLNSWMRPFKEGDTLTFTYVPGLGVLVDINTTRAGIIKGDDFARSLFAIWLGPKPPTGELKAGLLGKD